MKIEDMPTVQRNFELLKKLFSGEIDIISFENQFLNERREDKYWLEGHLDEDVERTLSTFFLDVCDRDNYHDDNDTFTISNEEFMNRAKTALNKLKTYCSPSSFKYSTCLTL